MPDATYVYCLVATPRRPRLPRRVRGLAGAGPVRLLDVVPGWWLAVADVPLARYGAAAINARLGDLAWVSRAAVAHETVVEALGAVRAVVPMKLFTIFENDERAAAHVRADRRRIERVVRRVAGRIEVGIRVLFDPAAASRQLSRTVAAAARSRSGVEYLAVKKRQRDKSIELAERASTVVSAFYDRLERRAALARRRPASQLAQRHGPLLLDAAFLVPRTRTASFRAAVGREAKALSADGYRVTMNGPWPPYSFIEE